MSRRIVKTWCCGTYPVRDGQRTPFTSPNSHRKTPPWIMLTHHRTLNAFNLRSKPRPASGTNRLASSRLHAL